MLAILTVAVRRIIHACISIKNSQILMFSRITFQKRSHRPVELKRNSGGGGYQL